MARPRRVLPAGRSSEGGALCPAEPVGGSTGTGRRNSSSARGAGTAESQGRLAKRAPCAPTRMKAVLSETGQDFLFPSLSA
jgi:hypothetical protein